MSAQRKCRLKFQLSAQQKLWLGILLFGLWLVLVSVALYRLSFTDYGEFDPEFSWLGLRTELNAKQFDLPASPDWQLVHVLAKSCRCSALAEQHISELSTALNLAPTQHFYRNAAEVAEAGLTLPAVPAVLVFNAGKLVYAGPYASGPQCSASDSFLPALLRGELALPAAWLNGETKACRCLTQDLPSQPSSPVLP